MNIIFHIPLQIDTDRPSASQIRPRRLMEAFVQEGYAVDVVEGSGRQRRKQIASIKRKIRQGIRYDFLYSESSTMPTLLTESHHLPTYPFLDFGFFRFCKNHHIPIGLFYRDIYWNFINKGVDWKQRVARYFYRYDLFRYRHLLDVLFLPTSDMLQHIPFHFHGRVVQLPSGSSCLPIQHVSSSSDLEIFYVGGLGGDYDLRALVKAVAVTPNVHLTLCCRTDDWALVGTDYQPLINSHISVVHQHGEALRDLYAAADLFALIFTPSDYRSFAAPYKLFEAIGYGVPLLATADTWSGRYVLQHQIGLVTNNEVDTLKQLLTQLVDNPALLDQFRSNLTTVAQQNTWSARCHQIANALANPQVNH